MPATKHMITWVDPRVRPVVAARRKAVYAMPIGTARSTTRIRWKRAQSRIDCTERAATRTLVLTVDACKGLQWLLQGVSR